MRDDSSRKSSARRAGHEAPAVTEGEGKATGGGWRQWAWFAGLYLASLLALLVVVSLVKLLLPVPG
jgi:hypothetical protein